MTVCTFIPHSTAPWHLEGFISSIAWSFAQLIQIAHCYLLLQKKMFNEVLVDTPPEMRRLSAASNQNAAGGIHPRRELSAIDAPAFLESLKSTPARPQQQQQDQFQRQKPVHTGRGLLRPASSDSRTSSSQNSNEQGLERSGSAGGMHL